MVDDHVTIDHSIGHEIDPQKLKQEITPPIKELSTKNKKPVKK